MEDFQKRMLVEFKELNEKCKKLNTFITYNPLFEKLSKQERMYQVRQLVGMRIYRTALSERLAYQGLLKEVDAINKNATERLETDNIMASELARKLNAAVEANGDHPVINSLTMPVPGGDGFSYVVYHKGDDHFELE